MHDDHLVTGSQSLVQFLTAGRGKGTCNGRRNLEIHQMNVGQGCGADPFGHGNETDVLLPGSEKGLHVRGGRTENEQPVGTPDTIIPHLLGVIDQSLVLLEGAVMLLIQNDHPRVGTGQKQGRPRPHDQKRLVIFSHPGKGRFPSPGRLIPMVQENLPVGEKSLGLGKKLQRYGHFRSQEQNPFASVQTGTGQFQIDPGLAASRDPVHQAG